MRKFRYIFAALLLSSFIVLPAKAEQETGTAGSSLGKEVMSTEEAENMEEEMPDGDSALRAKAYGWQKDSKGWWYLYSDGSYPKLSWRKIDGKWWYFNSEGYWVDDNSCETGTIKGIDVSEWQGDINWQSVKKDGIQFAFVRLGHDNHVLDYKYKQNMQGAINAGIPVGVYFYSTAVNEEQAILDAQYVIENMKGYMVSYPVAIDLEDSAQDGLSKAQLGKIAKAFCDEVRRAGYTPMLYSNENWYYNRIDVSMLSNVAMWIARYNGVCDTSIPRGIWQCCSTGRIAGIYGNVDINFSYTDYLSIVTPRTQHVEGYTPTKGYWVKDDKGWWYSYYNGGYPKAQWEKILGKWYLFDAEGYMKTGWQKVNGNWYYLDSSGAMQTGWQTIGGKKYYLNSSGAMLTGWQTIGGKKYYLDSSGVMQTGWQAVGGKWYLMNSSGVMQTGWQAVDGKWYLMNGSGVMLTGWQTVNGKKYYMNKSGVMLTGWQVISGKWYLMNGSGAMQTGWQTVNGKKYYMNKSGVMLTGWQYISRKWYYLNSSGAMQTGWQYVGGKWYYLDRNGIMKTGWQYINRKWYYLNSSGAMHTGWQYIDKKWYYLNSSGAMQTGWQALGGKWYFLNGSGVMQTGWLTTGNKTYYLYSDGVMAIGTQRIGGRTYTFRSDGSLQ